MWLYIITINPNIQFYFISFEPSKRRVLAYDLKHSTENKREKEYGSDASFLSFCFIYKGSQVCILL